jgi:electron transfer flavoprotein alpha/beta subunit
VNLPQPDVYSNWLAWAKAVVVAMLNVQEQPQIVIYGDFANDAAAGAAGVPVGAVYRTGSALKVRVS